MNFIFKTNSKSSCERTTTPLLKQWSSPNLRRGIFGGLRKGKSSNSNPSLNGSTGPPQTVVCSSSSNGSSNNFSWEEDLHWPSSSSVNLPTTPTIPRRRRKLRRDGSNKSLGSPLDFEESEAEHHAPSSFHKSDGCLNYTYKAPKPTRKQKLKSATKPVDIVLVDPSNIITPPRGDSRKNAADEQIRACSLSSSPKGRKSRTNLRLTPQPGGRRRQLRRNRQGSSSSLGAPLDLEEEEIELSSFHKSDSCFDYTHEATSLAIPTSRKGKKSGTKGFDIDQRLQRRLQKSQLGSEDNEDWNVYGKGNARYYGNLSSSSPSLLGKPSRRHASLSTSTEKQRSHSASSSPCSKKPPKSPLTMRKSSSMKSLTQEARPRPLLLDTRSKASIQSTGTRSLRKGRRVSSTGDLKKTNRAEMTKERRNKSFQELQGSGCSTGSKSINSTAGPNQEWLIASTNTTHPLRTARFEKGKRRGRRSVGRSFCPPRVNTDILRRQYIQETQQDRQVLNEALESKTVQQIQKGRQQQGQESLDNCQVMREAIKQIRSQLAFKNEMDKIEEVSRMHRHYEDEKRSLKEDMKKQKEVTKKLEKGAQELDRQQRLAQQEIMFLEIENEGLKKEQEQWNDMIKGLFEENVELELEEAMIASQVKNLTISTKKLLVENDKLITADRNLTAIYNGAIALKSEPGLKEVHRKFMCKCIRSVSFFEEKESELYRDVMETVYECEKQLGEGIWVAAIEGTVGNSEGPTTTLLYLDDHCFNEDNLSVVEEADNEDTTRHQRSLDLFCNSVESCSVEGEEAMERIQQLSTDLNSLQMTTLYENKEMLLTIFKFLDTDGSGKIDRDELKVGIDLLNKRLPPNAQFQDHEVLFGILNVNGDEGIDLQEFNELFSHQRTNIVPVSSSSSSKPRSQSSLNDLRHSEHRPSSSSSKPRKTEDIDDRLT